MSVRAWTWLTRLLPPLPPRRIFLFNHRFLLNEEERQQVRELVISLLADARVEVGRDHLNSNACVLACVGVSSE